MVLPFMVDSSSPRYQRCVVGSISAKKRWEEKEFVWPAARALASRRPGAYVDEYGVLEGT